MNTAHGIQHTGPAKARREHLHAANDPLTPTERAAVTQAQNFWMRVGAAFQDGRDECQSCGFCSNYEGAPGERLVECTLGRAAWHQPMHCAALVFDLAAEKDAASTAEEA